MNARTVDIDGPVHYVEYDGPADGPVFVLVHGLGGSHVNWMSVAPPLAARGRVLVPDLAGFGRTPLGDRTATIEANRALLDRFVTTVAGAGVILIGNSMGGAISIMQASERPETVAGLVLVDPACPRASGTPIDTLVAATFATYMVPGVGERFIARRARRLGPEGLTRQTLALCCVDPSRVDPEVVRESIALATDRMASMPWSTTAFLQAARSLTRFVARRNAYMNRVKAVSCPTLLLQGRYDRLVALGSAHAISRARPDWDFVVFDHLGHVPQLEDPKATVGAIERWLDGPAARLLGGSRRASEA